jgi:hypothetical protein
MFKAPNAVIPFYKLTGIALYWRHKFRRFFRLTDFGQLCMYQNKSCMIRVHT